MIDEESTVHTVNSLLDWPDEEYLEKNLVTAPESVRDYYLQER